MQVDHISTLKNLGFQEYNQLQNDVLDNLDRKRLLLLSPTGSGKTVGFLNYLIHQLVDEDKHQALIIAPTRELAIQIDTVLQQFKPQITKVLCFGGHKMKHEVNTLNANPKVIIGTPGRIVDHFTKGNIQTEGIKTLVVDEFDKLLQMGFEHQLKSILEHIQPTHIFLSSATPQLEKQTTFKLNDFRKLTYLKEASKPEVHYYGVQNKKEALVSLIENVHPTEKAIIFFNHRAQVEEIAEVLKDEGIYSSVYHGGLHQIVRQIALIKFENGSTNILLSTDLGARGLDIEDVNHVIHFSFPNTAEDFTHRNGRTNRHNDNGKIHLLGIVNEESPYQDIVLYNEHLLPTSDVYQNSEWLTINVEKGKKDKISKIDIVGFFCKIGGLDKQDLGKITVLDNNTFVAIKNQKVNQLLRNVRGKKIKGKSVICRKA